MTRWDGSRAKKFKDAGISLPLVPVRAGGYLLEHLRKAGPSSRDGAGGEDKLSWAEISAYCNATRSLPNVWEREALRDLSGAYLIGKAHGKHPLAIPYTEQDD